jgi:hypothetical protein
MQRELCGLVVIRSGKICGFNAYSRDPHPLFAERGAPSQLDGCGICFVDYESSLVSTDLHGRFLGDGNAKFIDL